MTQNRTVSRSLPTQVASNSTSIELASSRRFILRSTAVAVASFAGLSFGRDAFASSETGDAASVGAPDDPIDRRIQAMMEKYGVPGIGIAIIDGGRVSRSIQMGVKNAEKSDSIGEKTVFEAASLTKPVTATIAMQLVEQGRLDLDAPLVEYSTKKFTDDHPEWLTQVTARHVLTHTTGFPNWRPVGKPLTFTRAPGLRFSYSGEGFSYLQAVIEELTDSSLDEVARERVFDPLDIESANLVWRDDYESRLALGHHPKRPARGFFRRMVKPNAASSLVCTPSDYAKFLCAFVTPTADDRLLAPDSITAMLAPQVTAYKEIEWGLGWGLEPTEHGTAIWHWGNNGGIYHCFAVAFPDRGSGVVAMTNSGSGLKLLRDLVPTMTDCNHPAFQWPMVVF